MSGPVDPYSFREDDEECGIFQKLKKLHPEYFDGPGWSDSYSIQTIKKKTRVVNKGRTCIVPACQKPATHRGLCGTCYSRWRACCLKNLQCKTRGCHRPMGIAHGLCSQCITRLRRGKPLIDGESKFCSYGECSHMPVSLGLCRTHYNEIYVRHKITDKRHNESCLICGHSPIAAYGFCKRHHSFLRFFVSEPTRRPNSVRTLRDVVAWEFDQARREGDCLIARHDLSPNRPLRITYYQGDKLTATGLRSAIVALRLEDRNVRAKQIVRAIKTSCGNERCINYDHFLFVKPVDCSEYAEDLAETPEADGYIERGIPESLDRDDTIVQSFETVPF